LNMGGNKSQYPAKRENYGCWDDISPEHVYHSQPQFGV
jgi:hypothetical protein